MSDPKLLTRAAVLECYQHLINPQITDEMRRGLADELCDHIDAQGRLLAQAGNTISRFVPRDVEGAVVSPNIHELLAAIGRAMS